MTKVHPEYPTLKQTEAKLWENVKVVNWEAQGVTGAVPVGFETDGASVPRAFWALFPPLGKYSIAALVHDFLYKHHIAIEGSEDIIDRPTCDMIFRDLMEEVGVSRWKRWTMWRAVRAFGNRPYKGKR